MKRKQQTSPTVTYVQGWHKAESAKVYSSSCKVWSILSDKKWRLRDRSHLYSEPSWGNIVPWSFTARADRWGWPRGPGPPFNFSFGKNFLHSKFYCGVSWRSLSLYQRQPLLFKDVAVKLLWPRSRLCSSPRLAYENWEQRSVRRKQISQCLFVYSDKERH